MKRFWSQLPLWIRIVVIMLVLVMSIRLPFSPLISWLIWCSLVVLLLALGAIKLRLLPLFYLAMTFATMGWILVLLIVFERPLNQATGFWAHYPKFMMYLLAGSLVTSSVRLEEWVSLSRRIPYVGMPLSAILIAFPTAVASAFSSVRRAVEARKLSQPRSWYSPTNKETRVISQLDNLEVRTTIVAETALQLFFLIMNWRRTLTMATPKIKQYEHLSLNDIYGIQSFPQIYEAVFGKRPLTKEWQSLIEQHVLTGKNALDIGAGPGKLSLAMVKLGAAVHAIESNPYFAQLLRNRANEQLGSNHIRISERRFPANHEMPQFDIIVLHQNVMLELINEVGTPATWEALKAVGSPGGILLFDYPVNIRLPELGSRTDLLDITLPNFGHVQYGYVYEGAIDGHHYANVSLTTTNVEGKVSTSRVTMKGVAPLIEDLLLESERLGFEMETSMRTDAYTFFPSDMHVYALRLPH